MLLLGSVLSLVELVGLVNTNIVNINGSTQALTTSVSCDLVAGTNTFAQPKAGTGTGNGSVVVGGRSIAIPNANVGPTPPVSYSDRLLLGYSNVSLESSASAPSSSTGFTKLNLTGTVSLLNSGLLPLTFNVDLVSAQCGPGSVPASAATVQPLARGVAQPDSVLPASSSEAPPMPAEIAEPVAPETTASGTTAPQTTAPETASDEPEIPVVPEVEETTPPATTDNPTQTTALPTTTTTPPTTTTQPPDLPTVFTGPADGNVEALTLKGGVVCRAPVDADYSGTVELACDDGTSIGAMGSALTSAGVATSTVDGVWVPVLTPEGQATTVVAATRR